MRGNIWKKGKYVEKRGNTTRNNNLHVTRGNLREKRHLEKKKKKGEIERVINRKIKNTS